MVCTLVLYYEFWFILFKLIFILFYVFVEFYGFLKILIMASFDESVFEEKLLYLKDTQDSIGSLSSWCLLHKEFHEKIVSTWLNVLKKGNL